MSDLRPDLEQRHRDRGCLAGGLGMMALILVTPFALAIRAWRSWRRGSKVRTTLRSDRFTMFSGAPTTRFDLTVDLPFAAEPGFRRRLTTAIVRIADLARNEDDVYHVAYRLPWETEPVTLPVGPQLQELGDRFSLALSQGSLRGRTVVWLTLGRDRALAQVLDPRTFNPEADGEPDALFARADARWAMASSWAKIGPSQIFRVVLVVPTGLAPEIAHLLARFTADVA